MRLTTIGSTQLRFEGIDALELHFQPGGGGPLTHQPRPLADTARDYLTGELGLNPVPYSPPSNRRVDPPVVRDAIPGYILSRALEVNGRPIAFAFVGVPDARDGNDVILRGPLLRRSLNYRLLSQGHAYPLFYDTLFADLRAIMHRAAERARAAHRNLWQLDSSTSGLRVRDQIDLETAGVIFPKLFRRLTDFLAQPHSNLREFVPWLAATREQILDVRANNFTHFDTVVEVRGQRLRLLRDPGEIVFISAKTPNPAAAPWLEV